MSSSSDRTGRERGRGGARPRLRSAVAFALLVALAGCAGTSGFGAFRFGADRSPAPGLYEVVVDNQDDEPHDVSVVITDNGSVVRWTSFELGTLLAKTPSGRAVRPPKPTGSRGQFVIHVRIDGASTRTVDLTSGRFESMAEDCARHGVASQIEVKLRANATTDLLFGCE